MVVAQQQLTDAQGAAVVEQLQPKGMRATEKRNGHSWWKNNP
jgi:hypothetical protein